jgi:hypothetical protein
MPARSRAALLRGLEGFREAAELSHATGAEKASGAG